ncbi:hypothetical protein FIBSPDRAFT_870422 [Athelia psychrophila]|uniref:Uncharacterized protein n=1 Tax=Athelia psychrophila TaxID=1759441 RepID=A0A166B3R8_9AGAM|nr:hypothetical protein FIBSPDRAFT_870422 [Fibularhizoctonia sp. CBS 109695]
MSDNFVSFVASSSSLERLSIHHHKAGAFLDLVGCLSAAPKLLVLELDVVILKTSMSAVMHLMTDYPGSGGRILLPALEEFSIMGNAPDVRPFAKMIQSRNGNAIGVRNVPQLKRAALLDGIEPFDLSEEESRLFFDTVDSSALKLMVPLEVKDIFDVHRRLCGEIRLDPGVLWS